MILKPPHPQGLVKVVFVFLFCFQNSCLFFSKAHNIIYISFYLEKYILRCIFYAEPLCYIFVSFFLFSTIDGADVDAQRRQVVIIWKWVKPKVSLTIQSPLIYHHWITWA